MSTPPHPNPRRGRGRQHRQPKEQAVIPDIDGSSDSNNYLDNPILPTTPARPTQYTAATMIPNTQSPTNVPDNTTNMKKPGRTKKQVQPHHAEEPINNAPIQPTPSNRLPYTSQNAMLSPERVKSTPGKQMQAYAGPTFHASPAASSLPIPSFFSKSMPNGTAQSTTQIADDTRGAKTSDSPPLPLPSIQGSPQREESPLDFLFKAAIAAKAAQSSESPGTQSENDLNHARSGSNPTVAVRNHVYSPGKPRNHTRHPTEGSLHEMFPLEMDGSSTPGMVIGPAFATPYKDRMDAIRRASTPSDVANTDYEEEDRKAKSEALKRLLLNPQPQRPASASARLREVSNPFDAPAVTTNGGPQRHASGPSTPVSLQSPNHNDRVSRSAHPQFQGPQQPFPPYLNGSPRPRPPSSNLRRQIATASPVVELPGSQHPMQLRGNSSQPSVPSKEKSAEAKSMEDDLRRILKLKLSE